MLLQDFIKQVASSPLQMDNDESVHTDADPMQQAKQSKSPMAGFGALMSPVLLWTGGVVRLRYEAVSEI